MTQVGSVVDLTTLTSKAGLRGSVSIVDRSSGWKARVGHLDWRPLVGVVAVIGLSIASYQRYKTPWYLVVGAAVLASVGLVGVARFRRFSALRDNCVFQRRLDSSGVSALAHFFAAPKSGDDASRGETFRIGEHLVELVADRRAGWVFRVSPASDGIERIDVPDSAEAAFTCTRSGTIHGVDFVRDDGAKIILGGGLGQLPLRSIESKA